MRQSTRSGGAQAWGRPAALALAAIMGIAGLWLTVGAGAREENTVRAKAYPFGHKMVLDEHPPKETGSAKARFEFRDKYNGSPYTPDPQYERFECKLDKKPFKECESPQVYNGLKRGEHKFNVKLVYDPGPGFPSSYVSKTHFRWTVT